MKKHFTFPKYLGLEPYHHMQFSVKPMTLTGTITPGLSGPGFKHDFRAEESLPLAQSAPAVFHDTTRLCLIVVALGYCQIHADAVRALSWIFSMYFLLSDRRSPRLVKKTEVELVIKPLHPTLIGNTFVIKPFLTHCSHRSSYFSNLLMCPLKIFFKIDR